MSPAQQFLSMRAGGFLAVLTLTLIDTTTYHGLITALKSPSLHTVI